VIWGEDRESGIRIAQLGLDEMSNWCDSNALVLNKNKTTVMEFKNRKTYDSEPLLFLDKKSITTSNTVKYLGLTISDDLRWDCHIDKLCPKLTSVCYMIQRLRPLMDREVLLQVYYGCFHSVISYGIVFWGNSSPAYRIFLLQKRIIRKICNLPYLEHCKPFFKELKSLTLPSLYIFESSILVRRKPDVFLLNSDYHSYNTRNSNKIHVNQVKSTLTKKGPVFYSAKIYNKLPEEIRKVKSESGFKKALKEFLIEKAYYSLEEYLEEDMMA